MSARDAPAGAAAPLSARGERRRHAVLRHAAELFDARGYHRTQMSEIAAASGIRKTTLYHYFRSKDEILYSIHDEFIELLIASQEDEARTRLAPADQLLGVIADILKLMETHRGYVRVFFEHWRDLPPDARASIKGRRDHYERLVLEILRNGVSDGSFRDLDSRLAAMAIFGSCNWAYQWYDPNGPLQVDDIARAFYDQILNGIASPHSPTWVSG
jgi:AcrR family transcriptional regulator